VSGIVEELLRVPAPAAYGLIALLVFAEAAVFIGFVLPGETAVILGGVLASTGRLSLGLLLTLVVVAAIIGDTVGYEVGRHLGPRVLRSRPLRRHQERIGAAQQLLRERGGWAVLAGRFTAFLRAVMPGLAGASRMPYPRFLAFNALGGLVWGVAASLLGYFAGESYPAVERAVGRGTAVVIAVLIVVGLVIWHRRRRRGPAGAAPGGKTSGKTSGERPSGGQASGGRVGEDLG
jgi:membrane protein DedA with SNARE-associated domain